jgi:hypothetical protein
MKKLIVTATPTGQTTIEAEGFHGIGCTQASDFLVRALGTIESRTDKPEMHQIETTLDQHLHLPA